MMQLHTASSTEQKNKPASAQQNPSNKSESQETSLKSSGIRSASPPLPFASSTPLIDTGGWMDSSSIFNPIQLQHSDSSKVIQKIPQLNFHSRSKIINYFIYDNDPYQIVEEENKLAGGRVTDMVKKIFQDSDYQLRALVLPVARLRAYMRSRKVRNWLTYDIFRPRHGGLDIRLRGSAELSQEPILEFGPVINPTQVHLVFDIEMPQETKSFINSRIKEL